MLGEEEKLKGGSIFPTLQYVLFRRRRDCAARPSWVRLLPPGSPELPATWCWVKKEGGKKQTKKKKAELGSEMKALSLVCFKGKVTNACACVQKVAPAARACRQRSPPGPAPARRAPPPRLETAWLIGGLSLPKGSSQPFKPSAKPVLSLPGLWAHAWPARGGGGHTSNHWCDWDLATWIGNWPSGGAKALSSGIFTSSLEN